MAKTNNDTAQLNDKLDTIIALLNSLVESQIKACNKPINQPQATPTLSTMLSNYNLPNDSKFTSELSKLADKLKLTEHDLNKIFKSLNDYQQDKEIKDIRKLTYKFIYTYKQNKDDDIKY